MGKKDGRNAILCAVAVVVAFLLVNPFVQTPFDDDWSYAFTTLQFLRSGHILYNGWSAPLIITHTFWGALFARIFGYSFVVLRFSTLPPAAGCAAFAYLLARRCDVSPSRSVFCSLLLCLSPLFLPLATSFMTDVPAMFYTLLCLYMLVRARQSMGMGQSLAWIAAGVAAGIVGGMGRQTVWIVPLCVLPYLAIVRRREPILAIAAWMGFAAVIADMVLSLRWFAGQPWVCLDPPVLESLREGLTHPEATITNVIAICFTTTMLILPATPAFLGRLIGRLWRVRRTWQAGISAVVFCLVALAVARNPVFGMPPWLRNIVSAHGVVGGQELSGHRPLSLPLAARAFISVLVLAVCFLTLGRGVEFVIAARSSAAKAKTFFAGGSPIAIVSLFGLGYLASVIVRSSQNLVFDRYCLPLIPCIAILLLRRFKPGAAGWTLLAIYMIYAIAATEDNFALARARLAAIERLRSAGVPRAEIAAGNEYDAYVQLEQDGHVDNPGVINKSGDSGPNEAEFRCRYRVEYSPDVDTMPSKFGVVDYRSWLPPWHRRICIDQFRSPWWFNANVSGKNIRLPFSYEAFYDQ